MEPLHLEPQSPSPSNYDEDNTILSSSGGAAGGRTGAKRSLINDFNTGTCHVCCIQMYMYMYVLFKNDRYFTCISICESS